MTREEERKQAAQAYYPSGSLYEERTVSAFVRGAKWADENPKEGLVSIEKAAEWVKNSFKGTFGEGLAENIKQEFIEAMIK